MQQFPEREALQMHGYRHASSTAPSRSKSLTLTGRQGWRSSIPGRKLRTLPGHACTQEQRQLKCPARGGRTCDSGRRGQRTSHDREPQHKQELWRLRRRRASRCMGKPQ